MLFSCKERQGGRPVVSVSILPQKYFVERIAGDAVEVNVMVPPGMSPASCDLSTAQLKKLYDSDVCFTIGYLPFEITHLYPVLKKQTDIQLINHSDDLQLIAGSCGHRHGKGEEAHESHGVDPHIWLSPRHAQKMAKTVYQVLAAKYPEQQTAFADNYRQLSADIDSIAQKAQHVLAGKGHKSFLIYHPALTYFAEDYGLEQISIEDEGKEPNPMYLKRIIDTAKEKGIRIVFIQRQFDVGNAESVARQIGGTVIPIDPLNENWMQEMNGLIQIFEANLD